jgi:predicted transcriptional regulator of viral defense system
VESTYNYIENYLSDIQAKGRYAVTLTELKNRFDSSEKAIKQNIFRLKSKKQLAQVRKEFYVIVPPQYSNRGMIPSTLFIDDLMHYLNREYYIGLLSASAIHGAGHQQPMQFQVMIKKPPLRSIKNKKLNINFFVKSKWQKADLIEKKTETGYIKVSSPALTAFDLVHYNKKIGGLNRIIPILEDLVESINSTELNKTARSQKIPNMQRLGYLLEQIGDEKLATVLFKRIARKPLREIPISLAHKNREGTLNKKWNVIINTELDF